MIVLGVFQRLFGVLTVVFGLVITTSDLFGESFSNSLQKRLAMITACSRVAVPSGSKVVSVAPVVMPIS